jgi:hypothetical protein
MELARTHLECALQMLEVAENPAAVLVLHRFVCSDPTFMHDGPMCWCDPLLLSAEQVKAYGVAGLTQLIESYSRVH